MKIAKEVFKTLKITKDDEIIKLVERALDRLYKRDKYLINNTSYGGDGSKNYVSERSIVFRFALYFDRILRRHSEYKNLDLDCEYSRHIKELKDLPGNDFKAGVLPDVILHSRGNDDANILVIEFKTYWGNDTKRDYEKLRLFTDQQGAYRYKYGISIVIGEEEAEKKIFINGNPCDR